MNIYQEWLNAKEALDLAKMEELRLRDAICETHLEEKLEGSITNRFEGLKITTTAKLNRKVDPIILEALWDDLSPSEQECITYKPSLVTAAYRPIEELGGLLLEAVTVTPGQSSLKIVEEVAG